MATIQNLVGTNKIKDEWQKINDNFAALNDELTTHIDDVPAHVTVLTANQFTASEPITSYPMGYSLMRVTDSDFPNINGTVETVRITSTVGMQRFISSTSNLGSYTRGTTSGEWKKWENSIEEFELPLEAGMQNYKDITSDYDCKIYRYGALMGFVIVIFSVVKTTGDFTRGETFATIPSGLRPRVTFGTAAGIAKDSGASSERGGARVIVRNDGAIQIFNDPSVSCNRVFGSVVFPI